MRTDVAGRVVPHSSGGVPKQELQTTEAPPRLLLTADHVPLELVQQRKASTQPLARQPSSPSHGPMGDYNHPLYLYNSMLGLPRYFTPLNRSGRRSVLLSKKLLS